jgi:hypothetical protein
MELRISQSIIESHWGRLWAAHNFPPRSNVQFTLPSADSAGTTGELVEAPNGARGTSHFQFEEIAARQEGLACADSATNNQQQALTKLVCRGLRGRGRGSDKGPIRVPQGVAGR